MLSIVIPVHNEQATIAPLCQALQQVLPPDHEILFVDDGSTDQTWTEIARLHRPGQVRGLRFRRNFGKTIALQAGFAATRGEIIFTMDGDLQDDPTEIPRFLDLLGQGYDLVSGWKKVRHDPAGKVIASRLFNATVSLVGGLKLHDINCGFKAYRAEVAKNLRLQGEFHRFTPLLAHAMGYRVGELVVTHHPRRHGRSHYGFARLFKGFLDLLTVLLLTRYAERPSHPFGLAALLALLLALLLAWPFPLWSAASAISSVVFFSAGLVAEILIHRAPTTPPAWRVRDQLD
jgi:glycosyltransferase involved in cell wall biosynthesis